MATTVTNRRSVETLNCSHPLSRLSFVVSFWCCTKIILSCTSIIIIIMSCPILLCNTIYYFRLYGCLRLACGWILWHIRQVDDGRFRRHVCEALSVCYLLQALAVTRAQFTDRHVLINWIAIVLLLALAIAYGSFRFGKGGNLIKIYELPTASALQ
jgi:hypothetical protein